MLVVFIRTLILYIIVIVAMRLMGKRQIGQLQPFELAVAIMISELASVPMQNTGIPLINGIVPILTMLAAQILISLISLKSIKARNVICGKPSFLISNGKLNEDIFRNELYTINDLLEQLRNKDIYDIADVEYAILETNGQLSVIPKGLKKAATAEDLNLNVQNIGPAIDLIIDGELIEMNLEKANMSESRLKKELKKMKIESIEDCFFASVSSDGTLFCQANKVRVRGVGKK